MAGIDKDVLERLLKEPSKLVRIAAYKLYTDRYAGADAVVVGRRKEIPKQQLEQLLRDAHRDVAIRYPRP